LTATVLTLGVAAVVFSMVHWSNTSHVHYPKTRPGKPTIVAAPVPADFSVAKHEGVLRVAAEFVNTAVRRQHVDLSYDLATPALRSGYTRKTWATQDIPVQPYPLQSARYKLKGSFSDSVWLQVAVYPDRKHKSVQATVFDLTLKPFTSGKTRHWLVDSWAPAGYSGVPSPPASASRPVAQVEYKSALSQKWLFLPLSAFALGLVMLAAIGVRGWWRGHRAVKRYRSHSL
jgi:hypothetical protein